MKTIIDTVIPSLPRMPGHSVLVGSTSLGPGNRRSDELGQVIREMPIWTS